MWASRRAPLAARCLLLFILFSGYTVLIQGKSASSLVLGRNRATTTATPSAESPAAPSEEPESKNEEESTTLPPVNATTKSPLTGNPQIDYQLDPNLPRELNGYNLSDYPFFNSVPEDIDFKCDGLHDGFYASVPHKCQLYHHCLYGTRYDFLCANFTAFDQRTFICHFASEVDCDNSAKHFGRNEALYKQDSTTVATTSTTSTTTSAPSPAQDRPRASSGGGGGRRRRPFRRRRPVHDYYDDDYEDDFDYYQDDPPPRRPGGGRNRRPNKRPAARPRPSAPADDDYDYVDPPPRPKPADKPTEEPPLPTKPNRAVFEKPRPPPRIAPPVPVNERQKFARPGGDSLDDKPEKSRNKQRPSDSEYYDDYDDALAPPPPPRKKQKPQPVEDDYAVEEDFKRTPPQGANGRPLRRRGPSRQRQRPYDDDMDYREETRRKRPNRRPDDYDDEEDEPPRRKRPGNSRPSDDTTSAGSIRSRSQYKPQYDEYEEEDAPARAPSRKSSKTTTTTTTTTPRPRVVPTKRTRTSTSSTTPEPLDDDYYYDDYPIKSDEVVNVKPAQQANKPSSVKEEIKDNIPTSSTTTTTTTTTRKPFIPSRTKSPLDKEINRSASRFQFKSSEDTDDKQFEFVLEDYIKPTTRAPFIPRSKPPPQAVAETTPKPEAAIVKPAGFSNSRQKAPAPVQPTPEYEDDYSIETTVKPAPRPQYLTRVPASKLAQATATESSSKEEISSLRTSSRNQYKTTEPNFSSYDEIKPATRPPQYSPRPKIPSIDFTSPGAEEQRPPQRIKQGTPPSDIANKFPAPPPRSRLPTSFLPRGLSPVGGARSKATTPAPLLDIEDEEDDALNDALHPTGSDASSTTASRYSPFQSRSRVPSRGPSTSSRFGDETTAASHSTYSSIPLYDDEEDPEPLPRVSGTYRDPFRAQVPVQYAPSALDNFRQGAGNYRVPTAALRPQQFREPVRNERRPAASSLVQYATQQEPSTSWGGRDYFYAY